MTPRDVHDRSPVARELDGNAELQPRIALTGHAGAGGVRP
jgi:hypothetical protein